MKAGHLMNSAKSITLKAAKATDLNSDMEVIASNV